MIGCANFKGRCKVEFKYYIVNNSSQIFVPGLWKCCSLGEKEGCFWLDGPCGHTGVTQHLASTASSSRRNGEQIWGSSSVTNLRMFLSVYSGIILFHSLKSTLTLYHFIHIHVQLYPILSLSVFGVVHSRICTFVIFGLSSRKVSISFPNGCSFYPSLCSERVLQMYTLLDITPTLRISLQISVDTRRIFLLPTWFLLHKFQFVIVLFRICSFSFQFGCLYKCKGPTCTCWFPF